MTESPGGDARPAQVTALTAGAMLREARQAKGIHIAALAASIKVAQRKLELLEADRFEELPDATFTRALAHTLCRSLKIDPAPVLALLPTLVAQKLPHASPGLNAPFRDDDDLGMPEELQFLKSPVVLAAAGLLIAGALIYLVPAAWLKDHGLAFDRSEPPAVQSAEGASAPLFIPAPAVTEPAASAVAESASAAASANASAPPASAIEAPQPAPPAASPVSAIVAPVAPPTAAAPTVSTSLPASVSTLQLRASGDSWVEVVDARGTSLLSRQLQSGETVELDGQLPLRVKVGNASGTQVVFKGAPVELTPSRDNVAKLVLK